ncbi:hypothetical protein [Nocardiopsis suaedae]|uniref:DUF3040 domain-containing protein n=1 Tax=Nocardiopsis suaedae TaxID=3018444 RepID=A0ABT4TNA0_9ACTN|nr:hypothetical protein [Nocardiopsis suaedae]MDA2806171.1 hypothetical protein [Nocardiopsis suaedae]
MTTTVCHAPSRHTDARGLDAAQNAELAHLVRRLAAVRPEIIATGSNAWGAPSRPPAPAPRPELRPMFPPHLTSEDFPLPKEQRDFIARLRAQSLGRMRPGDHWPAHADDRFRAKMRRPLLRHRIADAVRDRARAVCTTLGAATLIGGSAILPLLAAGVLTPWPPA